MYGFDLKPEPRRRTAPRKPRVPKVAKGSLPRRVVYAMPRPILVRPVKGTARRMKRGRVQR